MKAKKVLELSQNQIDKKPLKRLLIEKSQKIYEKSLEWLNKARIYLWTAGKFCFSWNIKSEKTSTKRTKFEKFQLPPNFYTEEKWPVQMVLVQTDLYHV